MVWSRPVVRFWRQSAWNKFRLIRGKSFYRTVNDSLLIKRASLCSTCNHARFFSTEDGHVTPVFMRAEKFYDRTAAITQHGRYTYGDLLHYSATLATEFNQKFTSWQTIHDFHNNAEYPLTGERIAYLCDHDLSYLVTKWAVWMCGAIAVPLCNSHPSSELEYVIQDSGAKLLVCSDKYRDIGEAISTNLDVSYKMITSDDFGGDYDEMCTHFETVSGQKIRQNLNEWLSTNTFESRNAQIVYTSGTTGRPKGCVHTFKNLDAQIRGMVSAWGWSPDDIILHVLPLHHVHGIVNVLMTPLYVGAQFVMLPNFEVQAVWKALLREDPPINVFMGVPTMYAKLIAEYDRQKDSGECYLPNDLKSILTQKFRLMVSGSAALPQPIMKRWEEITGHTLLERFGMTETGMALTNPLHGKRIPGAVGRPFPGVSVSIVEHDKSGDGYKILATGDSEHIVVTPGYENEPGELLVKGDNVFGEYWNRPEATAEAFTKDGWFKTGDTAVCSDGVIRIVGRTSVDIIKSGGYKISALDIEPQLLEHPNITDVAVIGLPDETYGQVITAVLVTTPGVSLSLESIQDFLKDKLAPYQMPRVLKILDEMPRNSMGKVNKKQLAATHFPEYVLKSFES